MFVNLPFAMVLDNTTSPDYQLCVKTIVQWFSTLYQSFNWKTCCHLMHTCVVYVLNKESLGYTVPMGVPPKVQPMFVGST